MGRGYRPTSLLLQPTAFSGGVHKGRELRRPLASRWGEVLRKHTGSRTARAKYWETRDWPRELAGFVGSLRCDLGMSLL